MINDEKLEALNEINLAFASVSAYFNARSKFQSSEYGVDISTESELRDLVDEARDKVVSLIVDHLEEVVVRHDQ